MTPPEIDRSPATWPYKASRVNSGLFPPGTIPLDACYLSVKSSHSVDVARRFALGEAEYGSQFPEHSEFSNKAVQGGLRKQLGELLKVPASDITLKTNTCDGIIDIALGYPFKDRDKVVVYRGDYPSVYIPFLGRAEQRGDIRVEFVEGVKDGAGRDLGWRFEELAKKIDSSTALLVVSHVHWKSGETTDLAALGAFAKERGVRLVVDVAQSVGAAPVYPREHGIDAVVFPFWKGLLGPRGGGALYMSPEFRESIELARRTPSAQNMKSFGDVTAPFHVDGRRFEASTHPTQLFAQTLASLEHGTGKYGIERIHSEVQSLQRAFAAVLDGKNATVVTDLDAPTGLIVSLALPNHSGQEDNVVYTAAKYGVRITAREGFVRVAPHFFNSLEEVERGARILNGILSGKIPMQEVPKS